jgi:hypothetical protein
MQNLNLEPFRSNKRLYLKLALFTFIITTSSLLYCSEIFAIDESNDNNNNNKTLTSNLTFSNVTNITNNTKDSVYAQIVANDNNNLYMIWQESLLQQPSNPNNYDIFFTKSEDNGTTFSDPLNLSNNTGFSEHPQIAVSKNGIFVVWADNTDSNNTEIMFTKSEDNGTTFSKVINLSNNPYNSNNQEISAFDENVYVVWQDVDGSTTTNSQGNMMKEAEKKPLSSITFRASLDNGEKFNEPIQLANNTRDSYPKVNSYKEHVYVVWNNENIKSSSENDENSGLYFIKSSDKGNNFENSIRLAHYNFGESQIAVNASDVFIVWSGLHAKDIKDIYFVQSDDNGTTFTDPYIIAEQDTNTENRSYIDKINSPSNVELPANNLEYIVWQDKISQQNQDIFIITNLKNDENIQYNKILNLSNNSGISECPSITISKNYVYVVWEDITPGNHEILFTRGTVS